MPDNKYISRDEYNNTLQFLMSSIDSLKDDFTNFKKGDFADMRAIVKDLHKTLVESNGGRSIIDRLSYNEQKVADLDRNVALIIEQQNKKYKSFYDRFWVYFIRLIIVLLSLVIGAQFIENGNALMNIVMRIIR